MPHVSADGMTLAAHTTLRLGGPARRLVTATDADEIAESVRDADADGEPTLLLGGGNARAPLAVVREAVLGLRAGKGMVLDPADPDTYSAGSFFTNPVLDPAAHQELIARADGLGPVPSWPAQGRVKVSAAWLIERAGFGKGYPGAGVAVSSKHTLALTNRGTGTTAGLLDLAREIRAGVRKRFGITLHPEPVLVACVL